MRFDPSEPSAFRSAQAAATTIHGILAKTPRRDRILDQYGPNEAYMPSVAVHQLPQPAEQPGHHDAAFHSH